MKAAPADQERLLELQTLDSRLDRLAHRRHTLPELAELERIEARLAELHDEIVTAETEDGDLARDQKKLENEVDMVRSRAERDQQRLDAGQVSTPRELENLQSEIASLGNRQAELEDKVLELMEVREQVQSRLTEAQAERDRLHGERTDTEKRRDAAFAEIDAESNSTSDERKALAAALPGDLIALYEKVRESHNGVGAAALARGRCEGCHLQLDSVQLRDIANASPDEVLRCDECRRILVRTAHSGL